MDTRNRRRRQIGGPCNCLRPLIRIWGLFTAIVVCGVGVDITAHGFHSGYYILIAATIIFFLELKWILTLIISICNNNDHSSPCMSCWSVCRIAGGWRLAPVYVALAVALIIWPHRLWLSHVAGIQLIILALLRLCTIFKFHTNGKDEGLLPQHDDSFDKYDNISDIIDDSMPEPGQSLEDEEAIDDIDDK